MLRPSLSELHKRISSDIGVEAFPHSFGSHIAGSLAGCFHMLYSHTERALHKLLPDTAVGEDLERWGKIWGVTRKDASQAEGRVFVEAFGPGKIEEGTKFLAGSIEFQVSSAVEVNEAGKSYEVPIKATLAGEAGNLPAGTKVVFASSQKNMAAEGMVASAIKESEAEPKASDVGTEGGSDREDEERYRQRILFAIQNPPQGGAVVDYIRWISSVPGVHRAFVKTATKENPGTIGFSFLSERFSQPDNIKDKILEKLTALSPASVYQIEFVPFTFEPFPLAFSMTPSNGVSGEALRKKAESAVRQYFQDHFVPIGFYGERLVRSTGAVYLSEIHEILTSIEGKERYLLTEPKDHVYPNEGVYYFVK